MRHHVGEAFGKIDIAQEPDEAVEQQILHRGVEIELKLAGNLVVEAVDRGVQRGHAVAVADGGERRGNGGRRRAGLVGDAHDQRRAAPIDHRIGETAWR